MSATYFVNAKTERSSMMVGAADVADALRRAREMSGARLTISVTDRDGSTYSLAEFEAFANGCTAVECGERHQEQAPSNL